MELDLFRGLVKYSAAALLLCALHPFYNPMGVLARMTGEECCQGDHGSGPPDAPEAGAHWHHPRMVSLQLGELRTSLWLEMDPN